MVAGAREGLAAIGRSMCRMGPEASGVVHQELANQDWSRIDPGMTIFWSGGRPVGHVMRTDAGELRRIVSERAVEPDPSLDLGSVTMNSTAPSVSIVICTRDRPEELRRCLKSLPEQSLAPREVIVVDNASRDGRTREVAELLGAIYVREDRPGLDIARNTGARRATSEIIAYTDDDVVLHPDWLARLVMAFDEPGIGAVTGLVLPAELATEAQRHFEAYWSFGQGYERKDFRASSFAESKSVVFPAWKVGAGASMAFRKAVFARAGWFDERLDVGQAGCSGDSEYWYRLQAHGFDCRYEPSAVAFHYHRRTMEGLESQIFHYMRGHVAALLVQYERTGIRANLQRAFVGMPRWYLQRVFRRMRGHRDPRDLFLKQEIRGHLSGISFYYRQPRPVLTTEPHDG